MMTRTAEPFSGPKGPGSDWYRLSQIWRSMKDRCENPTDKDYPHYGARGIRICPEWHDFETFYRWAMSRGYRDGLTIDRVNNKAGYRPNNCRWVSRKAQGSNRGTNRRLRASDGEIHTIEEWSSLTGIPTSTMDKRLRLGWPVDEVVGRVAHAPRRRERNHEISAES